MEILRLTGMTLCPALLCGFFAVLEKTGFHLWKNGARQAVTGAAFGILAILSTEFGVTMEAGVIMNVRDAAPLCAGLFWGAPAGLIAGIMGGTYRWLCVYWGGGVITRTACSLAAFLAGVFGGIMRRDLFEGGRPGPLAALGFGTTMEVLHMLLVLATNLADVPQAFAFVQQCSFPMILCNGAAMALAALVMGFFSGERKKIDLKERRLSYDFGFGLLVCVVIAFVLTSAFTQQIVYRITTDDAELYRSVTLYLVVFMEILIYTALFILIYQMLKKKITGNLQLINDGLRSITQGNLDTVIDVRAYKEFADLSDDVNATVSTLKKYIREAEERINRELEMARQIQNEALPRVFPVRPDFELYAGMHAAREVGGDFYDFYMLDRYTLVFLVADVSGKGIPAAMFMMRAKTLLRDTTESGRPADEVFAIVNRKLCEGNEADMFLTAWQGMLDLRTGNLTYVNAGHNPPMLRRRNDRFSYLRSKPDLVLAGMEDTCYHSQTLRLMPGDTLYLYTDGVTEAANEQNELFGEARLEQALAGAENNTSARNICTNAAQALHAFTGNAQQSDDTTMLCVRLNAVQDRDSTTMFPDEESLDIVLDFLMDRLEAAGTPEETKEKMRTVTREVWLCRIQSSGAALASLRLTREGDILYLNFCDNGNPGSPAAGAELPKARELSCEMHSNRIDGENHLKIGFELD